MFKITSHVITKTLTTIGMMCTMRVQRATDDGMNALYIQKEESQLMCSLKEKFEYMYIY